MSARKLALPAFRWRCERYRVWSDGVKSFDVGNKVENSEWIEFDDDADRWFVYDKLVEFRNDHDHDWRSDGMNTSIVFHPDLYSGIHNGDTWWQDGAVESFPYDGIIPGVGKVPDVVRCFRYGIQFRGVVDPEPVLKEWGLL